MWMTPVRKVILLLALLVRKMMSIQHMSTSNTTATFTYHLEQSSSRRKFVSASLVFFHSPVCTEASWSIIKNVFLFPSSSAVTCINHDYKTGWTYYLFTCISRQRFTDVTYDRCHNHSDDVRLGPPQSDEEDIILFCETNRKKLNKKLYDINVTECHSNPERKHTTQQQTIHFSFILIISCF